MKKTLPKSVTLFEGDSKIQPQTWKFASKIYKFSFSVYEDYFNLDTCTELNTTGSILYPLACVTARKLSNEKILSGGHDLTKFTSSDDLFLLETSVRNRKD